MCPGAQTVGTISTSAIGSLHRARSTAPRPRWIRSHSHTFSLTLGRSHALQKDSKLINRFRYGGRAKCIPDFNQWYPLEGALSMCHTLVSWDYCSRLQSVDDTGSKRCVVRPLWWLWSTFYFHILVKSRGWWGERRRLHTSCFRRIR